MFHTSRFLVPLALLALIVVPGCAALQQLAALRTVTFAFAGVSDVRLAGIRIGAGSSYASLNLSDVARLGAAVVAREVPVELIAHVSASNPPANTVTAGMVDLGWTLYIKDRQALAEQLGGPVAIEPGRTADVPLTVRFDLLQLGERRGARHVRPGTRHRRVQLAPVGPAPRAGAHDRDVARPDPVSGAGGGEADCGAALTGAGRIYR